MKPHEMMRRGRFGKRPAQPQMRDRQATPPLPGGEPSLAGYPARRPAFPGETRQQELERMRGQATVVRPAPPPPSRPQQQQQATQPQPAAPPVIPICACEAHGPEGCGHVASLRVVWPAPDGGGWPLTLDVCELCAAALHEDPIAQLVTGMQFFALAPLVHEPFDDDDQGGAGDGGKTAGPDQAAPTSGTVTP
jgi:hypothetical protein